MRIAFIVGSFPIVSETFILDQITGLIDRKIDVDIYAIHPGSNLKKHPDHDNYNLDARIHFQHKIFNYFPSVFTPDPPNSSSLLVSALSSVRYRIQLVGLEYLYRFVPILKRDYDIIHAHFGPFGVRAQLLKDLRAFDGKIVTSFHGVDMVAYVQKLGIGIYENLFKKGDLFLPISNYWKNKLIEWGCEKDKIRVQRMGIKLKTFKFSPKTINTSNTIRLISVARLAEKKGLEYSIRAMGYLVNKGFRILYQIVGTGPLENKLKTLTNGLGLTSTVNFLGVKNRDEVIELLKESDIFILPSATAENGDMEGIPMVLMEAMAMGLPVISTFHSGIPELIQDGKTGFLTPEKDVNAIVEKVIRIIDDPTPLDAIRKNARKQIEAEFNVESQNDKLVTLYKNLI